MVVRDAINLLAAREGEGKSTVAASWAARETRSGGTVLWIGTEESRQHAQVPRLMAANADMDRVVFIDVQTDAGTNDDGTEKTPISGSLRLPLDAERLRKLITEYGVTMIVMDPCKCAVPGDYQGNDDVAVRQYLEPIAALCERVNVTLIGLVHFGKRESSDPGKLILGSVAWSQVARSVLSIAEDTEAGHRVLTNTKSNYSPHPRSIAFRIESATVDTADGPSTLGVVQWIGDTDQDARDLLGERRTDDYDERDYTDDLTGSWLYLYLADAKAAGTVIRPKDAVAVGADNGISKRSVFRLFEKLANAGLAASVNGKEFPRITAWCLADSDTTADLDPHAEEPGTTGTTAPDLHEQGGTTASLFDGRDTTGGTTADTAIDQQKHHQSAAAHPPVVPVVPPVPRDTPHEPPGGVTAATPGMTDRVRSVLARTSQQTGSA